MKLALAEAPPIAFVLLQNQWKALQGMQDGSMLVALQNRGNGAATSTNVALVSRACSRW